MLPFAETLSFTLNSVFIRESHHFRFLSFDILEYITIFTVFHLTCSWIRMIIAYKKPAVQPRGCFRPTGSAP